jgi:phosphatidylglycerol lysyltransferase
LLGDKQLLLDDASHGLLFQKRTLHWLAWAGVMGSETPAPALLRHFIDQARAHRAEPVFYQASEQTLRQLEATTGERWIAAKLGEEAIIDLHEFSLAGSARSAIRNQVSKCLRAGLRMECRFEHTPERIAQLRAISDS